MSSMPWIKLYTEILDDPKLGRLSDATKWGMVKLLFLEAKATCDLDFKPSIYNVASIIGVGPEEVESFMEEMMRSGIIEGFILSWKGRQPYEFHELEWEFTVRVKSYFEKGCERNQYRWQEQRSRALERDNHTCQYCGGKADQVDHVIPVCQGGSDELENLVAACAKCNRAKWGRTPAQAEMEFIDATLV